MHMPSDIQNESNSPSSEGRQHPFKDSSISLLPNVPASQDHNLKKEGFLKVSSSLEKNAFHSWTNSLGNLKIIPNPLAKVAIEE
jgi:hypothetical protein